MLLVAGDHQLAPDDIGRGRRSTRTVDAQDDGSDALVGPPPPDLLNEGVRSHNRPVDGIESAGPGCDRAARVEDGDPGTRSEPGAPVAGAPVIGAFDARYRSRGPLERCNPIVELIFV